MMEWCKYNIVGLEKAVKLFVGRKNGVGIAENEPRKDLEKVAISMSPLVKGTHYLLLA